MIGFKVKNSFNKTKEWLESAKRKARYKKLDKYAKMGIEALYQATPKRTGFTAESWYYRIEMKEYESKIIFCNSNVIDYVPVAIVLDYGHVTGSGGWVEGRHFIEPALQPIFDGIAKDAFEEVSKL